MSYSLPYESFLVYQLNGYTGGKYATAKLNLASVYTSSISHHSGTPHYGGQSIACLTFQTNHRSQEDADNHRSYARIYPGSYPLDLPCQRAEHGWAAWYATEISIGTDYNGKFSENATTFATICRKVESVWSKLDEQAAKLNAKRDASDTLLNWLDALDRLKVQACLYNREQYSWYPVTGVTVNRNF